MRYLDLDVQQAAQRHAVACYPNESCGAVIAAGYIPFENRDPNPTKFFQCDEQLEPYLLAGELLALVHSHPLPDCSHGPSEFDMVQQEAMGVPWGIVVCADDAALPPYYFGDMLDPPPLNGRDFRHGPSGTDGKGDCYALIRDYYRMVRGVILPPGYRDDGWWKRGADLYRENFEKAGFHHEASGRAEPKVGDVLLMSIHSVVPNHAAIYIGGGKILHHLSNRLSREEPLICWRNQLSMWLRHGG